MGHALQPYENLHVYQGDIHNHCGLSYGHRVLVEAVKNTRTQHDFVSVTPHAAWPDIPVDDPGLDYWLLTIAKDLRS